MMKGPIIRTLKNITSRLHSSAGLLRLPLPVLITVSVLAVAVASWTASTLYQRAAAENANRTVTICVDFQEIVDLCNLIQYPLDDCFARLKAIGVTQVMLKEETLGSLTASGQVITFPVPEYLRFKMLDVVGQGGIATQNALITADPKLADVLARQMKLRYGINLSLARSGKYQVLTPRWKNVFAPSTWNTDMPLGFSAEKRAYLKAQGFSLALSPQNSGNPQWIAAEDLSEARTLAWETGDIPGYPSREEAFAHFVSNAALSAAVFEFTQVNGMERFKQAVHGRTLIAHTIPPRELGKNTNPLYWVPRWKRAVMERSSRFLLAHCWPQASVDDNLAQVRAIAQTVRRAGFVAGDACPPVYPSRQTRQLYLVAALLCAVLFPLMSLAAGLKIDKGFESFIIMNCITLAGGLTVAACLSDTVFMQKVVDVPAVKISIFLPLLLAVFIVYPWTEIKRFFAQTITYRHIAGACCLLAIAAVVAMRSGNTAPDWLLPDRWARELLENFFVVRPRTKEFLIGQPLLLAGLLSRRRWMIIAGMIGQVSLINTFMHAHTAISISCVRALHGIWLGLIIGVLLHEAILFGKRHRADLFTRITENHS